MRVEVYMRGMVMVLESSIRLTRAPIGVNIEVRSVFQHIVLNIFQDKDPCPLPT